MKAPESYTPQHGYPFEPGPALDVGEARRYVARLLRHARADIIAEVRSRLPLPLRPFASAVVGRAVDFLAGWLEP